MKRHPQLTLRTPEKLAYVGAIMGNKEVIGAYFDLLEETLTKNGLLDKPGAIFNVDETGMPLDHKPEKAIAKKGSRNVSTYIWRQDQHNSHCLWKRSWSGNPTNGTVSGEKAKPHLYHWRNPGHHVWYG